VRTRRREKGNATTIFAVLGIAAGAMTLVAVLSVMNGFQLGTIQDILEIDSYHLRVEPAAPPSAIRQTAGVAAAIPFLDVEVLATGFFRDLQAIRVRALPSGI
jgi:lipoprotein-releasing system permease protein